MLAHNLKRILVSTQILIATISRPLTLSSQHIRSHTHEQRCTNHLIAMLLLYIQNDKFNLNKVFIYSAKVVRSYCIQSTYSAHPSANESQTSNSNKIKCIWAPLRIQTNLNTFLMCFFILICSHYAPAISIACRESIFGNARISQ